MQLHPVWIWRVLCIMPFDVNTGRRSNLLTAYSLLMPSAASLFTVLHIRDAALDWLQLLDVISVNVACFLVIIPSLTVPPPRIKLDPNAGNREILFVVGLHISLWFLEGSAATSAYRVFDTVITGYALQFSTVALGIGIKFAKINRNLDECLSTSIRTEYSRDQFRQQVLKALSSVWCQRLGCSDAVLAVSRNQGFQLCTVVASTFVTCVLLTTELVAHLIGRHRIGDGWRPTLARFILVVCRFVLVVRSSSMTANQIKFSANRLDKEYTRPECSIEQKFPNQKKIPPIMEKKRGLAVTKVAQNVGGVDPRATRLRDLHRMTVKSRC
ncbi:hypothetical protein AAG570_000703 [Ranatra chinensis]|uniref:Uncharacterized protein n=1 Tax=Ranatra chinensis TaxID=642074 RepID=A0ABD0ZEQ3_9HEMI